MIKEKKSKNYDHCPDPYLKETTLEFYHEDKEQCCDILFAVKILIDGNILTGRSVHTPFPHSKSIF